MKDGPLRTDDFLQRGRSAEVEFRELECQSRSLATSPNRPTAVFDQRQRQPAETTTQKNVGGPDYFTNCEAVFRLPDTGFYFRR